MASKLSQAIRLNNGRTATTSLEELTQIAERPMGPSVPVEGKVLGGTPDQAKMVGTPAQKQGALRAALQGRDLSTAMRQRTARTEATGQEQGRMEKMSRLAALDFEGRVEGKINKKFQEMAATARAETLQEPTADLASLFNRLKETPNDQVLLAGINEAFGRKDPETWLSSAEILQKYDIVQDPTTGEYTLGLKAEESLAEQVGRSVEDTLTIADFEKDLSQMGFQDVGEVATLLNIDEASLRGMKLPELADAIEAVVAAEYSQTEELKARLNDPTLSAIEKAELRRDLRDLGATGIRAAETSVDMLADEVANDNYIEYMGEDISVADLLSSEFVSGEVRRYLSEPDFAAELRELEPDFAAFIDRNKAAMLDIVGQVSAGVQEFATIQRDNFNLAKTDAGDVSDKVMTAFYPEQYGTNSAERIEPSPLLTYVSDTAYNKTERGSVVAGLNELADVMDQDLIPQFKDLERESLKQLGLLDKGSEEYNVLYNYLKGHRTMGSLKPEDSAGLSSVLGFVSPKEMTKTLQRLRDKMRLGGVDLSSVPKNLLELAKSVDTPAFSGMLYRYAQSVYSRDINGLVESGVPDIKGQIRNAVTESRKELPAQSKFQVALNKNNGNPLDASQVSMLTDELDTLDEMESLYDIGTAQMQVSPAELESKLRRKAAEKLLPTFIKKIAGAVAAEEGLRPSFMATGDTQADNQAFAKWARGPATIRKVNALSKVTQQLSLSVSKLRQEGRDVQAGAVAMMLNTLNGYQRNIQAALDKQKKEDEERKKREAEDKAAEDLKNSPSMGFLPSKAVNVQGTSSKPSKSGVVSNITDKIVNLPTNIEKATTKGINSLSRAIRGFGKRKKR